MISEVPLCSGILLFLKGSLKWDVSPLRIPNAGQVSIPLPFIRESPGVPMSLS